MTTLPPTSEPATTAATSTTLDRLSEIQAIFEDLERRRLDALYRGDVEAFSALFANEAYLERSLEAFELVEFVGAPETFTVVVVDLRADTGSCLLLGVTRDFRSVFGPDAVTSKSVTLELSGDEWGYSFETSEVPGWDCSDEHPLAS